MDEMRMKLSTKFMKSMVSKLLKRAIYKKFGYKVDIQLDDLDLWVINGDTKINLNVGIQLKSEEFMKIMKSLDLD